MIGEKEKSYSNCSHHTPIAIAAIVSYCGYCGEESYREKEKKLLLEKKKVIRLAESLLVSLSPYRHVEFHHHSALLLRHFKILNQPQGEPVGDGLPVIDNDDPLLVALMVDVAQFDITGNGF